MKYRTSRDTARGGGDGRDVPPSVRLDIREDDEEHRGGRGGIDDGGGGSSSFFEPRRERTPSGRLRGSSSGRRSDPPEKRLTLLALRLAVLEKAATGLGKLDFVWATVVLLGGFSDTLRIIDFWCVTVILLGEGARVFSRSHELEWQHHATQTDTGVGGSSSRFLRRISPAAVADNDEDGSGGAAQFQSRVAAFVKRRTWNAPEVSLLPYTGWVFVSRKIGRLLNWLQVLSALACVALSSMRLWKHDFRFGDGARNKRPALLLFYSLALLEATLFLLEKVSWTWKITFRGLLRQVSADCGLGAAYGPAALTRFFYDAYSRCVAGSVFDGIKMDLIAFAEDLILSDFLDEQLIGARVLQQLATKRDTLREVGACPRSIERLVEMLSWKRPDEEEVRRCAAEVVAKLTGERQNAIRLSAIPGAIESVMSLLQTADEENEVAPSGNGGYDHLPFNLLGLLILKRLAKDHDNCGKIGSTRGLLARIVHSTQAPQALVRNPHAADSQVRAVKRALRLVKMLVYTTGSTGRALRREVAENVFSVSHLRGILEYEGRRRRQHRELQKLAIDALTGLAMEEDGKQAILSTGGVVKQLLSIFIGADCDRDLGCEAGEALAMLALESKAGCAAILKTSLGDHVVSRILSALQEDGDARRLNAMRVLRNLCAYSGLEHRDSLRAATGALPAVLAATMAPESDKVLEASVGLTAEICSRFVHDDSERFGAELRAAGADERAYVDRLACVLRQYEYPEIRVPRMRRFVVQQVIWLMTSSRCDRYVELLREAGTKPLLESIADTTSGLESYHVFSGSVGIGKHRDNFSSMLDTAIQLLAGHDGSQAQE